jgi:hypothetical protein
MNDLKTGYFLFFSDYMRQLLVNIQRVPNSNSVKTIVPQLLRNLSALPGFPRGIQRNPALCPFAPLASMWRRFFSIASTAKVRYVASTESWHLRERTLPQFFFERLTACMLRFGNPFSNLFPWFSFFSWDFFFFAPCPDRVRCGPNLVHCQCMSGRG